MSGVMNPLQTLRGVITSWNKGAERLLGIAPRPLGVLLGGREQLAGAGRDLAADGQRRGLRHEGETGDE